MRQSESPGPVPRAVGTEPPGSPTGRRVGRAGLHDASEGHGSILPMGDSVLVRLSCQRTLQKRKEHSAFYTLPILPQNHPKPIIHYI